MHGVFVMAPTLPKRVSARASRVSTAETSTPTFGRSDPVLQINTSLGFSLEENEELNHFFVEDPIFRCELTIMRIVRGDVQGV